LTAICGQDFDIVACVGQALLQGLDLLSVWRDDGYGIRRETAER
jgi:hypothetical protein